MIIDFYQSGAKFGNAKYISQYYCTIIFCNTVKTTLSKFAARKWFGCFRSGNIVLFSGYDEILEDQQGKHISTNLLLILYTKLDTKRSWMYGFFGNWTRNTLGRINTCITLLKRDEIEPFQNHNITGNGTWIIDRKCKRS